MLDILTGVVTGGMSRLISSSVCVACESLYTSFEALQNINEEGQGNPPSISVMFLISVKVMAKPP